MTSQQKREAIERRARGDETLCRNRPQLQCERLDDFTAYRMSSPLHMATYERARRRANIALWTVALQRRRLHSEEPEDGEFVFRRWADFDFLVVSLTRLRRAAILAAKVPAIRTDIQAALKDFDASLPGLKIMRDVAEHFDDYAVDKGRNNAVERRSLEVGSLDERIFQWLGVELDTDIALRAGEQLFSAVANAKSKVVQPCP